MDDVRMIEETIEATAEDARPTRRVALRSVLGLAAAAVTLTGLAACGGEGDEGDEGDEEDEEDDD